MTAPRQQGVSGSLSGLNPSARFVRSLDGEYWMMREAAEVLRVSTITLRRLMKDDETEDKVWSPSFCAYFGRVKIYLYTRDDIERIDQLLKGKGRLARDRPVKPRGAGRPQMWTNKQSKELQRLYSKQFYYRRRVRELSRHENKPGALQNAKDQLAAAEAQIAALRRSRNSDRTALEPADLRDQP